MVTVIIAFLVLWLGFYLIRPDLRKEMITSSLLGSLFLLLATTLNQIYILFLEPKAVRDLIVESFLLSFGMSGVAAVLYEVLIRKHLAPEPLSHRHQLIWLALSPLATVLLILGSGLSLALSILIGLILALTILLIVRVDLIWDALLSGLFLGATYLLILLAGPRLPPGGLLKYWLLDEVSGLTLSGLPIEEIVVVFFFGALLGPLYEALKGFRLRSK